MRSAALRRALCLDDIGDSYSAGLTKWLRCSRTATTDHHLDGGARPVRGASAPSAPAGAASSRACATPALLLRRLGRFDSAARTRGRRWR